MHDALRTALRQQAVPLFRRVLDQMYDNAFWMERYGERGRRFADEDSLHHISYLEQALAADNPHVFERYAQWLRSVLVSRGMCSDHLAENFRLLAASVTEASLPYAHAATAVLDRGIAALAYPEGDASRLESHRLALMAAVRRASPANLRDDDERYLVSYLIDAVATGNSVFFEAFAERFTANVREALLTTLVTLNVRYPLASTETAGGR
jgi:hypothetical protein